MVGLDAAAAAVADDWEASDRWRYAAYCFNEVCALAGLRRDNQLRDQATATSPTATQEGATVKGGVIKGRVPYRPDLAPPGIDKLFPEGPVTPRPPGEILIA